MARSLKKGPFVDYKLMRKVTVLNDGSKKSVIKTWSRRSMILPDFWVGSKGRSSSTRSKKRPTFSWPLKKKSISTENPLRR